MKWASNRRKNFRKTDIVSNSLFSSPRAFAITFFPAWIFSQADYISYYWWLCILAISVMPIAQTNLSSQATAHPLFYLNSRRHSIFYIQGLKVKKWLKVQMFEPNVFNCFSSSGLKNDDRPQVHIYLKTRPNDRNKLTQHITTLWSLYEIIHICTAVVDESEEWSSQ